MATWDVELETTERKRATIRVIAPTKQEAEEKAKGRHGAGGVSYHNHSFSTEVIAAKLEEKDFALGVEATVTFHCKTVTKAPTHTEAMHNILRDTMDQMNVPGWNTLHVEVKEVED